MLLYILSGFLIGLLLPAISSRFGKILPADPGTIILQLYHKPHFPKSNNVTRNRLLHQKWKKLFLSSFLWGITLSFVFSFAKLYLEPDLAIYCLLPDFFTIPLLILGFMMSSFTSVLPETSSALGATFGYLIATVSVILLGFSRQVEFGAGDAKMMAAIGAWLGILGLNFALIMSFFFFAIQTGIQVKRGGAYGPALGIAGLITFFIIYIK